MVKQLLLATHNPAKIKELRIGVKELQKNGIQIVTLYDLNISEEPEETGKTFEENAILKAKYYGNKTNIPTIADDGGLIIPYLDNEPGVKSRRWLGYDATDKELIQYTLKRLNGVLINKRTAYLHVCVCFYEPNVFLSSQRRQATYNYIDSRLRGNDNGLITIEEKIKGRIAEKPSGKATNGYPFRALFIVDKFNKYYDELTEKEHEEINHRLIAVNMLVEKIKKDLL